MWINVIKNSNDIINKMDFIQKNVANLVTTARIILSCVLISLFPMSESFIVVYTVCGFTDAIDGFLARKLHIESKFGTVLDSIADLIFYAIMILKLWDILHKVMPLYIWIVFWTIIGLRLFLYLFVGYHKKELLSNHTILNKATGLLVFLIPYSLMTDYAVIYCVILEVVAVIAVIYEFKLVGDKNETR